MLAAQAFTSLIPFAVVASAVLPGDEDLADRIVERFGLDGRSARSVQPAVRRAPARSRAR